MPSLKSSLKKTASSIGVNKLIKSDLLTKVALVIFVILTFNYLNTRQYQATIFMYLIALAGYYMCKSLSCGLLIAIVLTNLLISMNYFKISENFKEGKDDKKKDDKKKDDKKKDDKKQTIKNKTSNIIKQLEENMSNKK